MLHDPCHHIVKSANFDTININFNHGIVANRPAMLFLPGLPMWACALCCCGSSLYYGLGRGAVCKRVDIWKSWSINGRQLPNDSIIDPGLGSSQPYWWYQDIFRCLSVVPSSCVQMGWDRQCDCGAPATPQNRNIGIQQEHLHGDTPARSRRTTAASPSGNLILNLNCCMAQAVVGRFLWRTSTSKTAYTWIICRSHAGQLPTM